MERDEPLMQFSGELLLKYELQSLTEQRKVRRFIEEVEHAMFVEDLHVMRGDCGAVNNNRNMTQL